MSFSLQPHKAGNFYTKKKCKKVFESIVLLHSEAHHLPNHGGVLEITKSQKTADKLMPSDRGAGEIHSDVPDIISFHNAIMLRRDCTYRVSGKGILIVIHIDKYSYPPSSKKLPLEKMETITASHNWTQCRDQ